MFIHNPAQINQAWIGFSFYKKLPGLKIHGVHQNQSRNLQIGFHIRPQNQSCRLKKKEESIQIDSFQTRLIWIGFFQSRILRALPITQIRLGSRSAMKQRRLGCQQPKKFERLVNCSSAVLSKLKLNVGSRVLSTVKVC